MSDIKEFFAEKILNEVFPDTVHVGLLRYSENEELYEISHSSYAREEVSMADDSSAGVRRSDSMVTFSPDEDWGEVTHLGLYDSEVDGNLWVVRKLDSPVELSDHTVWTLDSGDIALYME